MPDLPKIEKELSPENLQKFCERLYRTPKPTLETIQSIAAEFGIQASLVACSTFKHKTFQRHLDRIAKAGELAEQVAALRQAGAGHTITDAAGSILSDELLNRLVNRDDEFDAEELESLSRIFARLRTSETQIEALRHRIEQDQLDAARLAIEHARKINCITEMRIEDAEKVQRVRKILFGAKPESQTPAA